MRILPRSPPGLSYPGMLYEVAEGSMPSPSPSGCARKTAAATAAAASARKTRRANTRLFLHFECRWSVVRASFNFGFAFLGRSAAIPPRTRRDGGSVGERAYGMGVVLEAS